MIDQDIDNLLWLLNYLHKRSVLQSVAIQLVNYNVSGHYFRQHFFSFFTRIFPHHLTFLIEGVLESKNLFSQKLMGVAKKTWGGPLSRPRQPF